MSEILYFIVRFLYNFALFLCFFVNPIDIFLNICYEGLGKGVTPMVEVAVFDSSKNKKYRQLGDKI